VLPFLRLSAAPATLGAALALVAPDARAMGAIVTSPPSASSATELRVALSVANGDASGEGTTGVDSGTLTRVTRWLSARVHGDATAFALVLPVRAGAFVDVASDAWMEALEAASAPRVVPPQVSPPCGIAGGVDVEGDLSHEATVPPDAVAVAPDAATLAMELAMWGFTLSQDVASALDAAAATGSAFVVVRFPAPAPDVLTRTVRITEYEPSEIAYSLAALPLAGSGASTGVTAYVVGDTRVGWSAPDGTGAGGPLAVDPSTILWLPGGTSSYADARDALLRAHPGGWLEETAGHGPLFFRTPVPVAAPAAAVAQEYYERAGTYGDAALDPATCESLALSVAASTAAVAPACARGALALVGPAAPCGEMVPSGDIAPDVLRCGNAADDLALALSALVPQRAYLTRARSLFASGSSGQDAPLQPVANADRGPVLTAAAYSQACVAPDAGEPILGGGPGTSVGGWTGVGAGIGAGISATTGSNDNGNDQGSTDTPGVVLGGISDSASADDGSGCGGDSSTASSSGDSCGGDTSSTESSSGDESSSSGGCDGGGSSSSSSDSGGGACDGSSGSGSGDCTAAGGRSRRSSPGSRILLSLALVACVLRRSTRRAGLQGPP
jgi:hypothetical protein